MHARLTFLARTVWEAVKEDADELVEAAQSTDGGLPALEQVILRSLDLIPVASERSCWAHGRLDGQCGIGPIQLIVRDPHYIPVFLQVLGPQE